MLVRVRLGCLKGRLLMLSEPLIVVARLVKTFDDLAIRYVVGGSPSSLDSGPRLHSNNKPTTLFFGAADEDRQAAKGGGDAGADPGGGGGLFALKGYHDTKLEEVQKAAQVTTGAFFHHFGSKEELGFAVIDRHMEKRRQLLEDIEKRLPPPDQDDPLQPVFRRLDAIQEMIRHREQRKGGCIIGNLSTALSDTHDAFRRRLAECFEEMDLEFRPHLAAAAVKYCPGRSVDVGARRAISWPSSRARSCSRAPSKTGT